MKRCPSCKKAYPDQEAALSKHFNFCPYCGHMFRRPINTVLAYFKLIELHEELAATKKLIGKGEPTTAAREAVVAMESFVRKKSGAKDLAGRELMSKAFGFEFDKNTKQLKRAPLIALNSLATESERNEQEGMMLVSMGLMTGARNILAHHSGSLDIANSLNVVTTANFVLCQITRINKVSSIR
jgi:uncharacterized protein (TIGR02391 family)